MAGILTVQTIQGPTSGANANKVIIPAGQTLDASAGVLTPSAGAVIQTVDMTYDTQLAFSNTSYADTSGFSLSITPTSASSKILIICTVMVAKDDGNTLLLRLNRNGTAIGENPNTSNGTSFLHFWHGGAGSGQRTRQFYDSPATTSTVTYQVQNRVDGGNGYINRHTGNTVYGGQSGITLMEIAQ